MLVGAVQTVANWWADNRGRAARAAWWRRRWTSPGWASTASVAASAGPPGELRPRGGRRRRPGAARAGGPGARRRAPARSRSARWPTARRGWPGASPAAGVGRGDVVMTLVGNRPEWVYAMVAAWRLGAVAQPCTEQLRPHDLRARMDTVDPRVVVADERDAELVAEAGFDGPVLTVPDERLFDGAPAPAVDARRRTIPRSWCSPPAPPASPSRSATGTATWPGRRCRPSTGSAPGPATSAGAPPRAAGRSPPATCSWHPWLRGAAALLHDARFDPDERLELLARERVDVLCMAPTEYRAIAKRAELRPLPDLRHAVAAGEPLNPEVVHVWSAGAGVEVHDGYGQTETGALTGMPIGPPVRPGSMGTALPGFRLWIDDGELCVDPADRADLLPRRRARPALAHRRPRARGRGRLPLVRGPHRRRDHLRRLPDRAVRGRVGARLPPRGGRGRGRGGPGRRARPGGARGRGAAAGRGRRATSWPASSRSTCARRPRPTSTRESSSSPSRCRRRRAARSSGPSCAADRGSWANGSARPCRGRSHGPACLPWQAQHFLSQHPADRITASRSG